MEWNAMQLDNLEWLESVYCPVALTVLVMNEYMHNTHCCPYIIDNTARHCRCHQYPFPPVITVSVTFKRTGVTDILASGKKWIAFGGGVLTDDRRSFVSTVYLTFPCHLQSTFNQRRVCVMNILLISWFKGDFNVEWVLNHTQTNKIDKYGSLG